MVESQFDLDLSDVRVLDAFAGSGAISFELLSRGARLACLVDSDRAAQRAITENIKSLCAESSAKLVAQDVFATALRGSLWGAPFNLVILDPPYTFEPDRIEELLQTMHEQALLEDGARIVYEHDSKRPNLGFVDTAHFEELRTKAKGQTAISLWRYHHA